MDSDGSDEAEAVAIAEAVEDEESDDEVAVDAQPVVAAAADDDEVVLAAVVVDDDAAEGGEEPMMVQAEVVESASPPVVASPPKKKQKKNPPKKKKPANNSGGGSVGSNNSGGSKKKKKEQQSIVVVRPEYVEAAGDARSMLQVTAPTLPAFVADTSVRSFGRLFIDRNMDSSEYATTTALYPIGFSCDRYEFSPVHGRTIKLRCCILDGRKVIEKQKAAGQTPLSGSHGGPVFRIMWGQGVDEDSDSINYPYNPYTHSAPITSSGMDAVAVADTSGAPSLHPMAPEEGMRVRVRFAVDKYYCGSITKVGEMINKKKRTQPISIQYDDGSSEEIVFPDPDITLLLPGAEEEVDSKGRVEVTELNRKPVYSVVGTTPIEAWGRALIKMGMIDEIMFQHANDALQRSREEGLLEAKHRMKSSHGARKGLESGTPSPGDDEKKDSDVAHGDQAAAEPASMEELALQTRAEALAAQLKNVTDEGSSVSIELANARINLQGTLLCNPFQADEQSKSQQTSWLATAVRKEKMRMGSTGNKRKVVSALDLLERNDTYYNADIEALIEGLPGSEYCSSYIFQAFRSAGATSLNRGWVHEAKIKKEKEALQKLKKTQEVQEREHQELERMKKRKQREDDRDARKKQKQDEEDQKKAARVEERLSKLRVQVEDRLFNEANVAREKVVTSLARGQAREFTRRRKVCELVAAQTVMDAKNDILVKHVTHEPLPQKLGKPYDEEIIRVWNFFLTFADYFDEKGYLSESYQLDNLQTAIDVVRTGPDNDQAFSDRDAINLLTDVCVHLCKPLASTMTRVLFASLISLNPLLQKEFGAAFFNELNATERGRAEAKAKNDAAKAKAEAKAKADGTAKPKSEPTSDRTEFPDILFPVNRMTWQEVARVSFLADALYELGFQRNEAAHILRGYRSAGHPNSKESRRLRKTEDYWVAVVRQDVELGVDRGTVDIGMKPRVEIPCKPICDKDNFRFYLHNINSLSEPSLSQLQKQLAKAINVMRESPVEAKYRGDLEQGMKLVQDALSSKTDSKGAKKVRSAILNLFQKLAGRASNTFAALAASGKGDTKWSWQQSDDTDYPTDIPKNVAGRQGIGLLNSLVVSKSFLKRLAQHREAYVEAALKLKDEEKAEKDEEDDDEDEEDGEKRAGSRAASPSPAESSPSAYQKDTNGAAGTTNRDEKKSPSTNASDDQQSDAATTAKPEDAIADDPKQPTSVAAATTKPEDASVEPPPPMESSTTEAKTLQTDVCSEDPKCAPHEAVNGSEKTPASDAKEPEKSNGDKEAPDAASGKPKKVGKPSDYDDICGDVPSAPDVLRRCLAVLRTLCNSGQAMSFLNPVDPQSNPGYYDTVLSPMCLREAGRQINEVIEKCEFMDGEEKTLYVEAAVARFARNIRLMERNTLSYSNAGPTVISMGSELLRLFERLLLDWVLAPAEHLPSLEELDDDKCVHSHPSDEESTVLFCDGCEGKYNITRLDPPLTKVPKGDWYCPRCVSARWWGHLDPRVGKAVRRVVVTGETAEVSGPEGKVVKCMHRQPEGPDSKPSLMYEIEFDRDTFEYWSLREVDRALRVMGTPVPRIQCLEAVAESPGYTSGADFGLRRDLIPVPINPTISDNAAQVALSSSVYRDTIAACGALLVVEPKDMTADEWLRLLGLLVMKCASSDALQGAISEMESDANEFMAKPLEEASKVTDFNEILPSICKDDGDAGDDQSESENRSASEYFPPLATPVDMVPDPMNPSSKATTPGKGSPDSRSSVPRAVPASSDVELQAPVIVSSSNPSGQPVAVPGGGPDVIALALCTKKRRRKAAEDSITAYCVRSQLKPSASSFPEDFVSQVVDVSLATREPGLDFQSMRCRRMVCDFCGLTDVALGTPLLRVPNELEWTELVPHCLRNRRTHLIAEVSENRPMGEARKLISVKLRVDGEVFSVVDRELVKVKAGGMTEFLPRASSAYQSELGFRAETGLPFVTGSLSAHETCAVAAHNARKEIMVQRHKEHQAKLIEKDAAMKCGRTLQVGEDSEGRSYWTFVGDEKSLFVAFPDESSPKKLVSWYCYDQPETIASVIVSLGNDPVAKDIHRFYPDASKLVKDGTWSSRLYAKRFPEALAALGKDDDDDGESSPVSTKAAGESLRVIGGFDPYHVGEEVLVEAKAGDLFWDATVTGVSKKGGADGKGLQIDAYRVHYKGWNSRYMEWLEPKRVVEPSEHNRMLQSELLEERRGTVHGLPTSLNSLSAKDYLFARDRIRGNGEIPDFAKLANMFRSPDSGEITIATMKAAILAIEAALPIGCVDSSPTGPWRPEHAQRWRWLVQSASGPAKLIQCVIYLEDLIGDEWIKEDVGNVRLCLPDRWKAVSEATPSSLALRVLLLDRSIRYGTIDRKRFSRKKGRPPKTT